MPGALGVVVALGLLSRVGETTPYSFVLGAHVLLMVSLAALFTPVFTLSLGALPAHLYSHGSSLLGTTQQVSAAIGTALSVTVLTSRTNALLDGGSTPAAAFAGGVQWAFGAAALIAIGVAALVFLLPGRVPGAGSAGDGELVEADQAVWPDHRSASSQDARETLTVPQLGMPAKLGVSWP